MINIPVTTSPEGEEFETHCTCCGRPIFWGHGWLDSEKGALAAYWYQWSEGHQGRFALAVARFDDNEHLIPGVVSVTGRIENEAINYSIVEPYEAYWTNLERFGPMLNREVALTCKTQIFEIVDAIVANDQRISSRILSCGLRD
jgi:hypothetical protein